MDSNLILAKESYEIIGTCMEVHNNLGPGFLEVVYKEALEYEFEKEDIPYEREREYPVHYKDIILPHKFYADFVLFNKVILEYPSGQLHLAYSRQKLFKPVGFVIRDDG